MNKMEQILSKLSLGHSDHGVRSDQYKIITPQAWLAKLSRVPMGTKDGSHFIRSSLTPNNTGAFKRNDKSTSNTANLLIIDADKRSNASGIEFEGAPNPTIVSNILKLNNIGHIIYGTYSYYEGNKGFRYRIILATTVPYNKAQLGPTIENVIESINTNLEDYSLVNAKENYSWSQPWYYPRKPPCCKLDHLYFEYLEGNAIEAVDPSPLTRAAPKSPSLNLDNNFSLHLPDDSKEISVIDTFNEQFPLARLLPHYGYLKVYETNVCQKWVSPDSTSGIPGITVWNNRFYSHHNDQFHDGKPHDSFDLFRTKEGLTYKSAVIEAAKFTKAPSGISVDEHNKSLSRKGRTLPSTASNVINLKTGKLYDK